MSMHEEFMKKGGIKKLHFERISNGREGYNKVAEGYTTNVKFNEHGYTNESLSKNKGNDGR